MALDLLKRAEKGAALSASDYDATLTAIENAVNASVLMRVDIRQHGAIPAGSGQNVAANTAAIQAALTAAQALRGGAEVFIPHRTAFDPTGLEYRWFDSGGVEGGGHHQRHLTISVAGDIYPTTTWVLGIDPGMTHLLLRGVGGGQGGTYQISGRGANIRRPAGLPTSAATLELAGSVTVMVSDITVDGSTGIALWMRAPLAHLWRVAGQADNASTSVGIKISEGVFFAKLTDCRAGCGSSGKAVIHFSNEGYPVGNIELNGLITAGGPILFDRTAPASGHISNVRISNWIAENNGSRSAVQIGVGVTIDDLLLDYCQLADTDGLIGFIRNDGRIGKLTFVGEQQFEGKQLIEGKLPQSLDYRVAILPQRIGPVGTYATQMVAQVDGELEAANNFRGVVEPLQMLPPPFTVLPMPQAGTSWGSGQSELTITGAVRDPWGGTAGWQIVNTSTSDSFMNTAELNMTGVQIGDHIVIGAWFWNLGNPANTGNWDNGVAWPFGVGSFAMDNDGTYKSQLHKMKDRGWHPIVRRFTVTATGSGFHWKPLISAQSTMRLCAPFALHAPASLPAHEAERVRATITNVSPSVAPGSLGLRSMPLVDYIRPAVTGVSGLLSQAAHGGRPVHITGNVTVPVASGFLCEIRNKDVTTRTVTPASGSIIHNGVKLAGGASLSLPQYRVLEVKSDGTDVWAFGAIA